MIPKIIHYCWFGNTELPQSVKDCIASWKKYLPDYKIIEWNEDNFDVNSYAYTKEAYRCKKYAFVSDVARLHALYTKGGIYMDTDVEIIKPLDSFLKHIAFAGYEDGKNISTGIIASEKGGKWVKDNLENYNCRHFIGKDGSLDLRTNVYIITNYMKSYNLRQDNTYQDFAGLISIYPKDFFSPLSTDGSRLEISSNTHAIHHYMASWGKKSKIQKLYNIIKYKIIFKILPNYIINKILNYKENTRKIHYSNNF